MKRSVKKIWICGDVWMDILPSFDHAQLGLKMALLSPRFDVLVDTYFGGKKELTLWRTIKIRKDIEMPKLFVDGKYEAFPVPDHPLPNKIRFRHLKIKYIDHSVISFLRSNQQIWDKSGIKLVIDLDVRPIDVQRIWDVLAREIWPIFAPNIRHLCFPNADHLDNLRRCVSPTILNDLDQLDSIISVHLFPGVIAADDFNVPTETSSAGQALSKWLHTPTTNGQPKRLRCFANSYQPNLEWITNFKETFPRATTSVSYKIRFGAHRTTQIEPFELTNEQTKEKLTLSKESKINWTMKRCSISGETAAIQWENNEISDANLNNVYFDLHDSKNYIGPLSPPAANKSDKNVCSSAAGPSSDQRNE